MIVLYGDYKDLNYISSKTEPKMTEKHLACVWENFVNGNYDLTEQRIFNNEYLDFYKIFIYHHIFDDHCYTSYGVVDKTKEARNGYLEHCKEFKKKYIDRTNNVIVMETTELHGKEPESLEEIKQREIKYLISFAKRMKTVWEETKNNGDTELAKVYEEVIRNDCQNVNRWKNKTSVNWFC